MIHCVKLEFLRLMRKQPNRQLTPGKFQIAPWSSKNSGRGTRGSNSSVSTRLPPAHLKCSLFCLQLDNSCTVSFNTGDSGLP